MLTAKLSHCVHVPLPFLTDSSLERVPYISLLHHTWLDRLRNCTMDTTRQGIEPLKELNENLFCRATKLLVLLEWFDQIISL